MSVLLILNSYLCRWERPSAEVAAAVENRLNMSQKQIDESIEVLFLSSLPLLSALFLEEKA